MITEINDNTRVYLKEIYDQKNIMEYCVSNGYKMYSYEQNDFIEINNPYNLLNTYQNLSRLSHVSEKNSSSNGDRYITLKELDELSELVDEIYMSDSIEYEKNIRNKNNIEKGINTDKNSSKQQPQANTSNSSINSVSFF